LDPLVCVAELPAGPDARAGILRNADQAKAVQCEAAADVPQRSCRRCTGSAIDRARSPSNGGAA